ncbi:hypothetical protein Pan216_15960 [Planctomycetes bacterium Pan216]|uniref:Phytase-like domain-containing protein n=1 Tax=Kolteria novifilia TaxID=2527975 RepID=A0A518B1F0_9BACT|nr:hypothetical protein Pan216_15960 [Planctomycetes bacterium Pan216]
MSRTFLVVIGLAGGLLISDLAGPSVSFATTSDRYKNYIIVTGTTPQQTIDGVWILDYAGARLLFFTLDQQGRFLSTELDLLQVFQMGDASEQPRFMMATGLAKTNQIQDLLYLVETTTGQLVAIAPPTAQRTVLGRPTIVGPPFKFSRN